MTICLFTAPHQEPIWADVDNMTFIHYQNKGVTRIVYKNLSLFHDLLDLLEQRYGQVPIEVKNFENFGQPVTNNNKK